MRCIYWAAAVYVLGVLRIRSVGVSYCVRCVCVVHVLRRGVYVLRTRSLFAVLVLCTCCVRVISVWSRCSVVVVYVLFRSCA